MRLLQVAISSLDGARSRSWYSDLLGYLRAGESFPSAFFDDRQSGGRRSLGAIQGVPSADVSSIGWVVDQHDFFQFEVFEYRAPEVRAKPADWRPCDIGYSWIGLHVADFDATLDRLRTIGAPLGGPVGPAGRRRASTVDPDRVLLELMEDDVRTPAFVNRKRPWVPVATRSVTLSVPDLERSLEFFVETLGLCVSDDSGLHDPSQDELFDLHDIRSRKELLWVGDHWIEVIECESPRGRPRCPDYRISDQGILNIALGFRDVDAYQARCDAVRSAGYTVNVELRTRSLRSLYVLDDQGFSVELTWMSEEIDGLLGLVAESEQE